MKHHIIVKFKEKVNLDDIKAIFNKVTAIEGIASVEYHQNVIDRPNRYDLMIVINMNKEALEIYDKSSPHQEWKEKYKDKIEAKAIFDCE